MYVRIHKYVIILEKKLDKNNVVVQDMIFLEYIFSKRKLCKSFYFKKLIERRKPKSVPESEDEICRENHPCPQ